MITHRHGWYEQGYNYLERSTVQLREGMTRWWAGRGRNCSGTVVELNKHMTKQNRIRIRCAAEQHTLAALYTSWTEAYQHRPAGASPNTIAGTLCSPEGHTRQPCLLELTRQRTANPYRICNSFHTPEALPFLGVYIHALHVRLTQRPISGGPTVPWSPC